MKPTDLQTKPQRHLEGRQIGGDETDELFINNPEHPLKATERGNQTREVDYVKNQDRKPNRILTKMYLTARSVPVSNSY